MAEQQPGPMAKAEFLAWCRAYRCAHPDEPTLADLARDPVWQARQERHRRVVLGEIDPARPTVFHDLHNVTKPNLADARRSAVVRRLAGRVGGRPSRLVPRGAFVLDAAAREAASAGEHGVPISRWLAERHLAAVWEAATLVIRRVRTEPEVMNAGVTDDRFWRERLEYYIRSALETDIMHGRDHRRGGEIERKSNREAMHEEIASDRLAGDARLVEIEDAHAELMLVVAEREEHEREHERAQAEAATEALRLRLGPRLAQALVAIRGGATTALLLAEILPNTTVNNAHAIFKRLRDAGAVV